MDKNNRIGFFLLALVAILFSVYSRQKQEKLRLEEEAKQEQVQQEEQANANTDEINDSNTVSISPQEETTVNTQDSTVVAKPVIQTETYVLENEKLKLTFSNKGGRIIKAILKDYDSYETHFDNTVTDEEHVVLYNEDTSSFSWNVNGKQTKSIVFNANQNGNEAIQFTKDGMSLAYEFDKENPYLIQYKANLGANEAELNWTTNFKLQEKDMNSDREFTFLAYETAKGKFKKFNKRVAKEKADRILSEPLTFITQRQRFFNQTILSPTNAIQSAKLSQSFDAEDKTEFVKLLETEADVNLSNGAVDLEILISPNERNILRSVNKNLVNIQPKGILGLTKALAWLFDLFRPMFSNYGLLILVMTLLIKLILTPLTYRSYLSQAKMGVLKPEVAEINEKYAKDPARKQQETMKLYNKAGVNPLGGCIPSLLQIPIFFSLYYFFRSSIFFRQKEFLWAKDLSTYDDILKLPFEVPILGFSHISIFAVLYGIALFFSMQMTRSMGGPMGMAPTSGGSKKDGEPDMQKMMQTQMKFMQYAMPIFLPFIFNAFPVALTFYYFCYNIINGLQTLIIKKFVINEDKIHAQIQENKKKPQKAGGFRKRLEDAMKAQQELQEQQKRRNK